MRHNALHQLSRAFLLLGLAALAGILWVLAPLLAPLLTAVLLTARLSSLTEPAPLAAVRP